jgi:ABC-type multidrug transport system ATPase subunit
MIDLSDVRKTYRSGWLRRSQPVHALDGVTLRVESGTALGVVGLNGAGKSTLLRVLLGYVRPTSGEALISNAAPRSYVERHGIAYVPERVTIPKGWTVRGALKAFAMLGDLEEDAWHRVDGVIHRLGLDPIADRKVGELSKGNLQRVGVAQAIVGERKLMVLDEPTDGLDPVWIAELREILEEWITGDAERVLVLASHNLPEVEKVTNRVVLLHNGKIAGELPIGGPPGSLEQNFLNRLGQLEEARI